MDKDQQDELFELIK